MLLFLASNWIFWWAVAIALCLRWYHFAAGSRYEPLDKVDHVAAEMCAACENKFGNSAVSEAE
jgi:hypothetical protein